MGPPSCGIGHPGSAHTCLGERPGLPSPNSSAGPALSSRQTASAATIAGSFLMALNGGNLAGAYRLLSQQRQSESPEASFTVLSQEVVERIRTSLGIEVSTDSGDSGGSFSLSSKVCPYGPGQQTRELDLGLGSRGGRMAHSRRDLRGWLCCWRRSFCLGLFATAILFTMGVITGVSQGVSPVSRILAGSPAGPAGLGAAKSFTLRFYRQSGAGPIPGHGALC